MTRFTLTLVVHSGRWIAPALTFAVWLLVVVANPGTTLDNAANLFFALLVVGLWLTVTTGNVDDDPHRDLCAASVGGAARLQATRQLATLAALCPVVLIATALAVVTGTDHRSLATDVAGTMGLLLSGALVGIAIGGFLHRPILANLAWTVVLGAAAALVVAVLPPLHDVLRDADRARLGGVAALSVVSAFMATGGTWLSAALAARRN
jgi:hypothetical protein